jgi:carboxyl-terminal processing protease
VFYRFCAALLLALSPASAMGESAPPKTVAPQHLRLFHGVLGLVREKHVDVVPDEKLIESALNGMLSSLDPYSAYLDEPRFRALLADTSGGFTGIGTELILDNGLVRVVSPIDDTPAFRADVRPGDYIAEIDDVPLPGLSLDDVAEKTRGPVGSEVRLKIHRTGEMAPLEKTLTREHIDVHPVRWEMKGNIAYLRLKYFNEHAVADLLAALAEIKKAHTLEGIVLDLRNNPGGVFDVGVSVASIFLPEGAQIVSIRERDANNIQQFASASSESAPDVPMVVLINNGSASCSEVVAGALQDNKRAVILGMTSFGKGSVQTIIPISPGYTAVRLTTGRYYTPSGRPIQARGVEPDIVVEPAKVVYQEEGDVVREKDIPGALKAETEKTPTTPIPPHKPKPSVAETPLASDDHLEDYQLVRALDLLKTMHKLTPVPVS